MLDNYKLNIVLTFLKPDDKGGEPKPARVTLGNVRKDLTVDEIKQVAAAFETLIMHPMGDTELVQFSRVRV